VVQGVRDAIGREPANADRVVGTSAGAAIAATLLAGTPTDEVIELISSPPSDADREQLRSNGTAVLRNPIRALRPVAPSLILCVRHVGATTALAGLLPAGLFPTVMLRQFAATQEWPAQLWVPSVRLNDGRTVVFGRDQTPGTVGDALEATSAIPGVFQPKTIDGSRYVDGAVASSTHADTLVGEQVDVALISAPSARSGGGPLRARARRSLEREDELLRASGALTRILVPSDEVLEAAEGFPRKRPEAAADIVEAARQQTIAAFRSGPSNGTKRT
jgi:NTE family protein